jgi:uncharacterized small protein (DUF1192 family)
MRHGTGTDLSIYSHDELNQIALSLHEMDRDRQRADSKT